MIRLLLYLLLVSCTTLGKNTPQFTGNRKVASQEKYGVLILSDIHLYASTNNKRPSIVPLKFQKLLEKLEIFVGENNIKFLILLGDCTSGNVGDQYSLRSVTVWWDRLKESLQPLMQKGLRIFPVAGNHDYYTQNHRDGYRYAWCLFVSDPKLCPYSTNPYDYDSEFNLSAPKPEYYSLSYRNLDLFFLHAVDYSISKEQEAWLQSATQASKQNQHTKLAFGHVALYTRMIEKPFAAFGNKVSSLLRAGNIHHYMNGHEHYFWDEFIGETKFRQTIVGTSSGTYNYAPHLRNYERFCKKKNSDGLIICEMEPEHTQFLTRPSDRKQIYKQMFVHLEIDPDHNSYKLNPYAFYDDEIVSFNDPVL
ncbi:MAG: metallophosphoesterase [Bdellovibrio sp.]|nr:metallophosphoesterase [Bdellovibrio sp.]